MFATLDPTTRVIANGSSRPHLLIDTVGFIQNLPHSLIEAFHATLEEVTQADILIHVLDCAHPRVRKFKQTVDAVLAEIGAAEIPLVLALNKSDLLGEAQSSEIQRLWSEGILISAQKREGLKLLIDRLNLITLEGRSLSHNAKGS